MLKKDIKIFFKAISNGDVSAVSSLVSRNPGYLSVCNVAPPKKDDGQSGLQVAFKNGSFEIARFMINQGADVNFMERSDVNEWTAPVLHDCIRATLFNTYTLQKNTNKFDEAFSLLELMLEKRADPNAVDSYGNNCLHRALLDARQMIENPGADMSNDILLNQVRSIFKALINAGADVNLATEKRPSVAEFIVNFKMEKYQLI